MSGQKNYDIKAPDGFLLGGLRKVRADGSVLFMRDYWQAPKEWAGESIWLHYDEGGSHSWVDAAPPGEHIYTARFNRTHIRLEPIDRPSAKPAYRTAAHKAWAARSR